MMSLTASRPVSATVPAAARTSRADPRQAPHYRHDLDGVRGVAIALVAMFHVWFGRVSGGVDVFLVLSGFFFGGMVIRTALEPGSSLSLVPQLTRLVRRLLPALCHLEATVALEPKSHSRYLHRLQH